MKSFKSWIELREFQANVASNNPMNAQPSAGANKGATNVPKVGMAAKDPFLDRIRSIMKTNPKGAAKQISTEYDTRIAKETKPAEIARLSKEKSDTLSSLQS